MEQETVLVIEDDSQIQDFLCNSVLRPLGYRVLQAFDGQEGLEKALADQPNLILLDLMLPRLSGLEMLQQLREQGCQIPTIVLTLYGTEETILRAFRLGAKDFLQKPFGVDEVPVAIGKALAEDRLHREKERLTRALTLANRRLQQQVRHWIALNEIAQAITSTLDESEIFRRVMESVNCILQVEAGSLLLVEPETRELEFVLTLEGDTVTFSDVRLAPGQGIAGWVAQHGEALLVPDVSRDSRFCVDLDRITGFQTHSILCVPLQTKGQTIGVLEVINKRQGPESPVFTHGDMELLTTLASWMTVAVENARLNRAAQELAATTTLRQAVTTIAHHVNNRLMTFSLELDEVERNRSADWEAINAIIGSARQHIREITTIIKALDQLETIETVSYVGAAEMIDIEDILEERI